MDSLEKRHARLKYIADLLTLEGNPLSIVDAVLTSGSQLMLWMVGIASGGLVLSASLSSLVIGSQMRSALILFGSAVGCYLLTIVCAVYGYVKYWRIRTEHLFATTRRLDRCLRALDKESDTEFIRETTELVGHQRSKAEEETADGQRKTWARLMIWQTRFLRLGIFTTLSVVALLVVNLLWFGLQK